MIKKVKPKPLTPMKAIRAKCIDCSGDNRSEVALCVVRDCPLWYYRSGKKTGMKRNFTEEQRKQASDRLRRYHEKEKSI
jgi:hypothetical protein